MLLIHLMSAGRLQLYDRRAGPKDRTSRLLVRVLLGEGEEGGRAPGNFQADRTAGNAQADGNAPERELRLREFGSKQAAWVKLLRAEDLEADEQIAKLGPEAWPEPPSLSEVLDAPRPLHAALRDQHVLAGIGRSWVDEILWEARFRRSSAPMI